MKKTLCTWFFIFMAAALFGQNYHVSSVTGNVQYMNDGKWSAVIPRETLMGNDKVRIGKNSAVSVIDRQERKLYSLGESGEAQLSKIIKSQTPSATDKFFDKLWSAFTRGDTEDVNYSANVVYKDIETDNGVYAALNNPSYKPTHPVRMVLVDRQTGEEVTGEATIGNQFIFRITNASGKPLYINVLDISSDGGMYDCLPMDKGGMMLHLLIPAGSTMDIADYPMEFTGPRGADTLILIASEQPFDLRNVIKLYEKDAPADAAPGQLGIFKMNINVQ